jgi:hypothetical protein
VPQQRNGREGIDMEYLVAIFSIIVIAMLLATLYITNFFGTIYGKAISFAGLKPQCMVQHLVACYDKVYCSNGTLIIEQIYTPKVNGTYIVDGELNGSQYNYTLWDLQAEYGAKFVCQTQTEPNLTAQINLDSDGGILTINATFFNINTTMTSSISTWYSSYKINSATEELPNGTVIIPATSYVQKQIQIDCQKYIYLGNSNYYSC